MSRADYCISAVTDSIVFLYDEDRGNMSVTNDAEQVYAEVTRQFPGRRVVYRDSMGSWDEIIIDYVPDRIGDSPLLRVSFKPYADMPRAPKTG